MSKLGYIKGTVSRDTVWLSRWSSGEHTHREDLSVMLKGQFHYLFIVYLGGAAVSTPTEKIHMEWKTAENARTEQRMKHR